MQRFSTKNNSNRKLENYNLLKSHIFGFTKKKSLSTSFLSVIFLDIPIKGSSPIILAFLTALAIERCCFAVIRFIRLGRILPLSVILYNWPILFN